MSERLIWNFEFDPYHPISPIPLIANDSTDLKWEKRFFWPADEVIHLNKMDSSLIDIKNYQQKHKEDFYYLLPKRNLNIKRRRGELLYKPVIKKNGAMLGYGPKINLHEIPTVAPHLYSNPEILQRILVEVEKHGIEVFVKKESFTFKFPTTPHIKLELARLEVNNKIYFSACVEGRSMQLVQAISDKLLQKQKSCSYVSFLKSILK